MVEVNASLCPQNHPCPTIRVCPTNAVSQHGFGAPTVDPELCIDCCKCVLSCPAFVGDSSCEDRLKRRLRR